MAKKDTFHKGQFQRKGLLDLPEEIAKDIEKRGWVYRWINHGELMKAGGQDHRGWMPYRIPDELRVTPKPGEYIEGSDYRASVDGFFRRMDVILAVMPKHIQQARRADSQRRTKEQENIVNNVKRKSRNVSVEKAEKQKGFITPTTDDILED